MSAELMTDVPPPRFPWLKYWLVLAVIVVVIVAPLVPPYIARVIAESNGCVLDERVVHECRVESADRGELLFALTKTAPLFLVTMPLGGIAALGWAGILIPHRMRWGSRRRMVRAR